MKKLLAAVMMAGLAGAASAAGVHVEDGWARATVEGMKMGGAFMKIHNDEAKQDFLLGGSSPVAERVEVHTHINDNGVHYLLKGLDQNKDQSYFLYRLKPFQLERAIFPLGGLEKPEVRRLAAEFNLPTAAKKDSTGICFIGERPFREFLQKYLPTDNGKMVTPEGKTVGEHVGLMFYTLGQRKGLGIGGAGEPWFVAAKDLTKNELIVVQGHDHPLLYTRSLVMNDLSFTLPERPKEGRYTCKTRYRMADAPCELRYLDDETVELVFDEPQWAVTPGQSAVLYEGNVCLGGGIIQSTDKPVIITR